MRRIALLAVSQCFGIIAFCQSPAILSGTAQTPQPLFNLNSGQFAQNFPSNKLLELHCDSPDTRRTRSTSLPDVNQPFHVPCMNPQLFALNAEDYMQLPTPPHSPWPQARSIPIPTQWPGAKPEPIPTTWPNLKLLPLAESKPDSTPAR